MPGNDAPRKAWRHCLREVAGNGARGTPPRSGQRRPYTVRGRRTRRSDGLPSRSFGRRRRVSGAPRRNTCRRIAVTPLLIPRRTVQTLQPAPRHLMDAGTTIRRPHESPDFGRTTGDRPRNDKTYFLPTTTMTSLCLRGRPPTVLIPGNLAK